MTARKPRPPRRDLIEYQYVDRKPNDPRVQPTFRLWINGVRATSVLSIQANACAVELETATLRQMNDPEVAEMVVTFASPRVRERKRGKR